ncbi:putative LRR receptor-like serine/threonine-protein kinase [Dorcoceras hygrometricum]|uniref:Putative LRR receptor-like serine/threonine-protein kinase n=1 Tax=Dorcoceras hygrometricum TaxID=472368 RepID=A0A2Z7B4L0_9LAMI|nr:putative LRR receptor-like serine/threonine-protein kinase [Dorcoceras hygrometricum]
MAGLQIVDEEVSFLESASNQPLALEFSSLADQEQAAAPIGSQKLDQPDNENTAMTSHEHQAQENEPPVQTDGHQAVGNEHQANDEHGFVQGSDRILEDRSAAIVPSVTNPKTITTSEKKNSEHQGPAPSNLQLVVPPPTDLSTLQFMDTTAQNFTTLSTHVSSLDLTYSRIRDDNNLTRHHTTLIRDQLKTAVEGLDIKIDVLERTLSQRIDDIHQHFTKLETTMVRNYADSHQQLVDELASVKSHLAAMVESMKEFGATKRGKEDKVDRGRD